MLFRSIPESSAGAGTSRPSGEHHFLGVHHICESMGLAKIMEFKHYYNERVIMQFYATLFIVEEYGVKKFVWKTGGKRVEGMLHDFAKALGGIPMPGKDDSKSFFRLHDYQPVKPTQIGT